MKEEEIYGGNCHLGDDDDVSQTNGPSGKADSEISFAKYSVLSRRRDRKVKEWCVRLGFDKGKTWARKLTKIIIFQLQASLKIYHFPAGKC